MNFFLDTNICIYFLKGKCLNLNTKIQQMNPAKMKIPSIVKSELLVGALKSRDPSKNKKLVLEFLEPFTICGFDDKESEIYSVIRSELEMAGTPIGPNDLILASIVLGNLGTLVTNNEKEFSRIPSLKIENWCK